MAGKEGKPQYTPEQIQDIEYARSLTAAHAQLGDARYGNDGVLYFSEGQKRRAKYQMEGEFKLREKKEKKRETQKRYRQRLKEASELPQRKQ